MTQVRELLDQQKEFYKTLIEQQERNFKSCLEILVDSSNKRVGELQREVNDLKTSLEFTQKEFLDFKNDSKKWRESCKETVSSLDDVKESLISLNEKTDYAEAQSKRNNLIFDGINESDGESWSDSEEKVRKLMSENLKLDPRKIELERAHRTGKSSETATRPRPIVVKFLRYKDKVEVLSLAKELKGTNIYINEDFSEAVRQKRKDLLPAMKAARERGDLAYLRYDKLIVRQSTQKPQERKSRRTNAKSGASVH